MAKVVSAAPNETSEFLSGVNVFNLDKKSMKPEPASEPFICDPSIKLNSNELKLLARGPKFMVREDVKEGDFEVELEKMIAKKKLDSAFSKDDLGGMESSQENVENSEHGRRTLAEAVKSDCNLGEKLWEEQTGNMVYNIKTKTFDFGNMRATQYKHNKQVFLPDPESIENETNHEYRKSESRRIFSRVVGSTADKTSKSRPGQNPNKER